MKTKINDSTKTIISYVITFLSSILLKIEGFISLFQQLSNTKTTMTTLQIFELIALPFFFLGVFIYFDKKFKAIKQDLKTQIEILKDDSHEIDMYLSTVQNRKTQYLYDCIKANTILPEPKKWMTEEEERLHSKNFKGNELEKFLKNALFEEKELEHWKA